MARVDVRTRLDEEHPLVDPDTFFASELPAAIEELRAGRATKVEVVGFD